MLDWYDRQGELMHIELQHRGSVITVSDSSTLHNYPLDGKETIMSRLLDLDENVSKAAFEKWKAHMKANS